MAGQKIPVLIITYYWPPGSGAGVQRWLKFSKYLPEFGWEPHVLTVDPDYAAYPARDVSLENDIPAGVTVYKTRATDYFSIYKRDKTRIPSAGFATGDKNNLSSKLLRFIRGNVFIPDPRKGWNSFAYKKACEIIENKKIRHIITTSPPHSTQLIGLRLKKKFPDIKWIADFRDPWTDIYYYDQFYPTAISKKIDRAYEINVLKTADQIITVGKSLKDLFVSKTENIERKIEVITNGFDDEDFKNAIDIHPDRFTISYIGTLSDAYPVDGLLEALERIRNDGNDFLFRLAGTVSPAQKQKILDKTGIEKVEFIPYVSHHEAINYMMSSTILLLIIPDHRSNKSILTGKIFEYLASFKPVICLGPVDGDAAEIIAKTMAGKTFGYNDVDSIILYLNELNKGMNKTSYNTIKKFRRTELTKHLVGVMK